MPVVIITIAISSSIVSELFGLVFAMLTDGKVILHEYCVTGMYKIYAILLYFMKLDKYNK